MLDSYSHVEIAGVRYRLAESSEGDHYRYSGEPLRNQNYAVVEASGNQQFQLRPDIKIWAWTDWSGGEGQFRYDPDNPAGYWKGNIINPVVETGTLRPGAATEKTNKSAGGTFEKNVLMVKARDKLYAMDQEDRVLYNWVDASSWWDAGTTNASGTVSTGAGAICGDASALYYIESANDNIFKWNGTTFTLWNTDTSVTGSSTALVSLGKYIYLYQPTTAKVWEIPKSGTAPVASTLLFNFSDEGGQIIDTGKCQIVAGHNRVYFSQITEQDTVIYEITPTTASGTGFARELARIDGFTCEALTFHMGFLYLIGRNTNDTAASAPVRMILYLEPGGEYGTLGILRADEQHAGIPTVGDANSMLLGTFAMRTSASNIPLLFCIDAVTGAVFCLSRWGYGDVDTVNCESVVEHRGEVFWATDPGATGNGVYRTLLGKYFPADTDDSYAISPIYDFGLVEKKVLQSLRINCAPMPASWDIYVDYQIDQSGSWVNAGTYTTDNGVGTTYVISTDSATVSFYNLQLRVRFSYTGGGNPTTCPVLYSVEARSSVMYPIKSWTLLLDLSDEVGQSGGRSLSGTALVSNLATAFALATVVDFKDGYIDRAPNQYNQYDVTIDGWEVVLDRPGEGYAVVRLVEVA